MKNPHNIDWSVFKNDPVSQTCECVCGAEYRSHAKAHTVEYKVGVSTAGGKSHDVTEKRLVMVSMKPCPKCGEVDTLRRISSDPEKYSYGG